jgi:hypothetical protein
MVRRSIWAGEEHCHHAWRFPRFAFYKASPLIVWGGLNAVKIFVPDRLQAGLQLNCKFSQLSALSADDILRDQLKIRKVHGGAKTMAAEDMGQ